MNLTYELVSEQGIECCRELCNELMALQKTKTTMHPELFEKWNFDTRMIPSVQRSIHNHVVVVKDGDTPVAYVYSNVSPKEAYMQERNHLATFFDMETIKQRNVGCLSQFFIKEEYRSAGIGSKLFNMSMEWLRGFDDIEDYFIFVSHGNAAALEFYRRKGFTPSHEIMEGFITVMRNNKANLIKQVELAK